MSSSGLSFLIEAVGLSMYTTYPPWVGPCKCLAIVNPQQNSRVYMVMLVIPTDLINLHDFTDLHKYQDWYRVILDLVSNSTQVYPPLPASFSVISSDRASITGVWPLYLLARRRASSS